MESLTAALSSQRRRSRNLLDDYRRFQFQWQSKMKQHLHDSTDDHDQIIYARRDSAPAASCISNNCAAEQAPSGEEYFQQQSLGSGANSTTGDLESLERWERVLPEWRDADRFNPSSHEYRSLDDSILYARRRLACAKFYREQSDDLGPPQEPQPEDDMALMFRTSFASERTKLENIIRRQSLSEPIETNEHEIELENIIRRNSHIDDIVQTGEDDIEECCPLETPAARNNENNTSMRVEGGSKDALPSTEDRPVSEFKPFRDIYRDNPRDLNTTFEPIRRKARIIGRRKPILLMRTILHQTICHQVELMRMRASGPVCAVKHYSLPQVEPHKSRIEREYAIGVALQKHQNIALTFGLFPSGPCKRTASFSIAIEYCPAGTLAEYLCTQRSDKKNRNRQLTSAASAEAWGLWKQLLSGVAYMHEQNIAHTQLHPQSLHLVRDGGDGALALRITDFSEVFAPEWGSPAVTMAAEVEAEAILQLAPHPIRRHDALGPLVARPYRSPEVIGRLTHDSGVEGYDAFALDAWAVGTLLLALLHPRGYCPWPSARRSDPLYGHYVSQRRSVLEAADCAVRTAQLQKDDAFGCALDVDPAPHFERLLSPAFAGVPPDWAVVKTILTLVDVDPSKRLSVTQAASESWVSDIAVGGGSEAEIHGSGMQHVAREPMGLWRRLWRKIWVLVQS